MKPEEVPDYRSLPAVDGMPPGCTWGLWDVDGVRDQLGTLNFLTPQVVLTAKEEISTGRSVSVNWQLNKIHRPGFGRRVPGHKFIELAPRAVHDDEIHINTQSGSQWDGFKHFAHQGTRKYYNGLKHEDVPNTEDNGIHHWNDRGGIVGRGVLLDYVRYAEKKGIEYDVMTKHGITVETLKNVAQDQNVTFKPGDILIVRSGFTKWYNSASQEERDVKIRNEDRSKMAWAGVQGCIETSEWLWNHHFSAVAGDSISWEVWPFDPEHSIHEFGLSLCGRPIGEIWDLEKLAETCEHLNRWSFFFTSCPLNIPGGVASPPNALCIF